MRFHACVGLWRPRGDVTDSHSKTRESLSLQWMLVYAGKLYTLINSSALSGQNWTKPLFMIVLILRSERFYTHLESELDLNNRVARFSLSTHLRDVPWRAAELLDEVFFFLFFSFQITFISTDIVLRILLLLTYIDDLRRVGFNSRF